MTTSRRMPTLLLGGFSARRPPFEVEQSRVLAWLADAHTASEAALAGLGPDERAAFAQRIRKRIARFCCDPNRIRARGTVVSDMAARGDATAIYDDLPHNPRGRSTAARSAAFAAAVNPYFEAEYAAEHQAPSDLIHVTCTGYVAPSPAQRLVSARGWGDSTRVTHAYHMGCNAAFPALRIGAGCLATGSSRVDVVHTELCTLHLDPSDHSAEQLVVQSLFADGLIRYTLRDREGDRGLRVLALAESILPDSADTMQWVVADTGLHMTLARDVAERLGPVLRPFVADMCARAGIRFDEALAGARFAIHPGGPKIIDQVREALGLSEPQVETSRQVLYDHGNMSSATLPHVWMRMAADRQVAPGTAIVSLAFGPGLTVCGGVMRKQ
jgi:predicted naringenin-chalcone synthase